MSKDSIKEYLVTNALLVLLTIGVLLPSSALSLLCSALLSALIGYLATRFHYGYVGGACVLVVAVIFLMAQDLFSSVYLALPIVLCGLTLAICKNLSLSPIPALSVMTLIRTLSLVAGIRFAGGENGENIFEQTLLETGETYQEVLSSSYGTSISQAEIDAVISESISMIKTLMPSFIIIASILISVLCFYFFKRILMHKKKDVSALLSFSEWRAEKGVGIVFFLLLLTQMLVSQDTMMGAALLNVIVIMFFVFYLFGLSFLEHILKARMEKSFVRKLILIGISFVSFLMIGLPFIVTSIIGAADSILNLRQRKQKR